MIKKLLPAIILFLILTVLLSSAFAKDEPSLPAGLKEEPDLPLGLGLNDDKSFEEPDLPQGLSQDESSETQVVSHGNPSSVLPFELSGFWEVRIGARTQSDANEKDASLGETRLQVELEKHWSDTGFKLITDFLYDPVFDDYDIRLEENEGWLSIREAVVSFSPLYFLDIKAGRQILTWGTGDMLFINDLFPKDWVSFFIGRDEEYLKLPSDALKISLYNKVANLDIVYTPRFDSDRFIDGDRLSYWNPMLGKRAGRDNVLDTDKPDDWFYDDELAARLFKNIKGYELAFYAYNGFWKVPAGINNKGEVIFPKLRVYGASGRGTLGKGIGNIELGYYDSAKDRNGDNPAIQNSQFRALAGYEQEVAADFTVAVQYYLEYMSDYNDYRRSLPTGSHLEDKDRHVLTLRLSRLLMNQNLELSLFTYYSPSDKDAYFRPRIHYKIDDYWSAEIGGNIFLGKQDYTFFAQFEKNSNLYTALRYSF